jgi:perosamine synthetase
MVLSHINSNHGAMFTFFRGRVALYALLRALDIGPGIDVALQAFTCVAVPEAIMATGARPIYIDVEKDWVNMAADDLARKITPSTRAIVVQHTFGIPGNMAALQDIAENYHIPLIEDCCHSLSSRYRGKNVGEFGIGSFYSFEWGKPLVAGLGGGLILNDGSLQPKIESLHRAFSDPDFVTVSKIQAQYLAFKLLYRPSRYWLIRSLFRQFAALGILEGNYHPIQGEQGVIKDFSLKMASPVQKRIDRKIPYHHTVSEHARWVAREYQAGIRSPWVEPVHINQESEVVYARYPWLTAYKSRLLAKAREANVELSDWYATPVHPLSNQDLLLVGYERGSCPHAESVASRMVTLPTHPSVNQKDIDRTVVFFQELQ